MYRPVPVSIARQETKSFIEKGYFNNLAYQSQRVTSGNDLRYVGLLEYL